MATVHVIKQNGSRPAEHYDHDKLHRSVRAACLSVRSPEGEAEIVATKVATVVSTWCQTKTDITSDDVRHVASRCLETFHPEAAYLYKNHQLVV